jgi:hypothetical protein
LDVSSMVVTVTSSPIVYGGLGSGTKF